MILRVANPIYDSVFKYLVEDLRIAKILISALLKKEVLEVEVRKHEYTNGTRDNISMFRIDFGAKVRESDGSFVESLVHDSIIVQIPRLHGRVNNRLEKVLSVFDQTHKDKGNRQMLNIDEDNYEDDTDMMYILRRLLAAASDAKLRQDMNVEDEYFTAIENRDTAIMNRDKKIAEQDQYIAEQSNQIAEQSNQIAEQSNQIAEQSNQIAEQSNQIAEQSNQIAEQSNQIAEQSNQIAEHLKTLKSTIQGLANRGMSLDDIAVVMGKSVEEIKSIIG